MTYTATVTSKGQVTIPQEVRNHLGIKKGHIIKFRITSQKDKEAILKVESIQDTIDQLYGALGGKDIKYIPYRKARAMAGKMLGEKYKVK